MTFLPECGADKSIFFLYISDKVFVLYGFKMIPCMSDLVE